MKTLTVITTTYNRDYCLHQVYESLCRQSLDDFVWMIIDDGSTDKTKELVAGWIAERRIDIEYHYKTNGGMHTARNLAYKLVKTELNVIIDSDDWMTDNAVELIVKCWKQNGREEFYGMVANNIDTKGKVIGSPMPTNIESVTCTDLFGKYGVKGDKKLILRSDLSRLYPYPEFEGEKFYPASYKFKLLDQERKLYLLSEAICIVDYNTDSMTYNKYSQYKTCCRGFAHYRNEMIKLMNSPISILREVIHYIAESKFAGNKNYIRDSAKPFYTTVALPAGLFLYIYLSRTKRKY